MHSGKHIFAQLMTLVNRYDFDKCVDRYNGNYRTKDLSCWEQFLYLSFGQLTFRESIHDIINCMTSQHEKAYHMGIKTIVAVSSITRANENRNWRIYSDFAQVLIKEARSLYLNDNEFILDLDNTVYALDSSTIDLSFDAFFWAKFRKNKSAVKIHTLLDLRGNIPCFIDITDGKIHDVNILDKIVFEAGAFYVMDKGYVDFERLYKITLSSAFFVTRAKKNMSFRTIKNRTLTDKEKKNGVRCDQQIKLTVYQSKRDYPDKIRRIKFYDNDTDKGFVFITNNFTIDAILIAKLYKNRWQVELFFKWIKQHLKIKSFWGFSENAVKMQIWIAVCAYLITAIAKKRFKIEHSQYEIMQILSTSIFEKKPLNELFTKPKTNISKNEECNQLILFNL
jgi:transposase